MISQRRLRIIRSHLLMACVMAAEVFILALQGANAQTVTIDFRFDTNGGTNPTPFGATTVTLLPGSAGQTYTVDVFATVSGGTPAGNNGLKDVLLRGISDIVTASSAFATGTGIGAVAGTANFQYLPPFNAGGPNANTPANPVVKVSDLGSTNASTAGNTTNSVANATADGILDFGGTVASQVFAPLSFTNAAQFGAFNGNGVAVGSNAFSWEIGTFRFTTGTASTTSGTKTMFFPAAAKGSGGGDISINGSATTQNVPITIGSALTFIVQPPFGSASWNRNGNGNYSDFNSWDPNQIPGAAGLTATFGNGTTNAINVPNVTVTVDAPQSVGTINFNNTNGTSFTLGNDGVAGHSLTLDNSGAGANVNSVTGNNSIFSNLVLNDNTTFNVSAGSSVLVSLGSISEAGASRSITKTGAGTLTIDTPSTYTGSTLVTGGTLLTTPTGTISTGPLVVSAATGITSLADFNNNQTVSSLSGTVSGSGSATVRVASGTTLTVNQASNTTFSGAISLASGGGTLLKSGTGVLETDGAPTLGGTSAIQVSGGTLRFNVTSGAATVGSGVVATVSNAATLQLAGSVSAFSSSDSPAHRVNIANSSSAAAGLLVSGTNQQVGNIDGNGTTSVAAGAGLTANHIVQAALVIGGTAGSPATVTIAASNASGNPLADSSGSSFASSLSSNEQPQTLGGQLGQVAIAPTLGATQSGNSAAVPEPSTLLLIAIGAIGCLAARWRNRMLAQQNA